MSRQERLWGAPLPAPDGAHIAWSVWRDGGYLVESIPLDAHEPARALTPSDPRPVELVAWDAAGETVFGCRGAEVVAASARDGLRVLARTPKAPTETDCSVYGTATSAAGPVLLYYRALRRIPGFWRPAWLLVSDPRPHELPPSTRFVGVLDGTLLLTVERTATSLVATTHGRDRTLVPWTWDEISFAWRTPNGATVVWVEDGSLHAIAATGGAARRVSGPLSARVFALTDDRALAFDREGARVLSYRLDGRDAEAPQVVLTHVSGFPRFSAPAGRVAAMVTATPWTPGRLVAARIDGSDAAAPPRLLGWGLFLFERLLGPPPDPVVPKPQKRGERRIPLLNARDVDLAQRRLAGIGQGDAPPARPSWHDVLPLGPYPNLFDPHTRCGAEYRRPLR